MNKLIYQKNTAKHTFMMFFLSEFVYDDINDLAAGMNCHIYWKYIVFLCDWKDDVEDDWIVCMWQYLQS